ncbi:MAG: response regulator [Sphingobium sp.]
MTERPLIAVVDDDEAIRIGLSSLLRSEGYAVDLFHSAEAFLQSLPGRVPHCLLTDIQMPGLSGLDLLASMKRQAPGVPVLILTAFPEEGARLRARSTGAADFLAKPFDASTLIQSVRRAIAGTGA